MKTRLALLIYIFTLSPAIAATTEDVLCELRTLGVSLGSISSEHTRHWQDAFTKAKDDLRLATSSAHWHRTGFESANGVEIIDAESLVGQIVAGVVNLESRAESVVHTFLGQVLSIENSAKLGDRPLYSATILDSDGQTRQIIISLASPLRVRRDSAQERPPLAMVQALTPKGPYEVIRKSYLIPAQIRPEVTAEVATEIHAEVYQPKTDGPVPTVIILHGNGPTAYKMERFQAPASSLIQEFAFDYRHPYTGQLLPGFKPTLAHLGFAYVGEILASHGIMVISVNSERGVNEVRFKQKGGSIHVRARLVLAHIRTLLDARDGEQKDTNIQSIARQIDFRRIGLMGHSRGAEGVRLFSHLLTVSASGEEFNRTGKEIAVRGVFEIAPSATLGDNFKPETIATHPTAASQNWAVLMGNLDRDAGYIGNLAYGIRDVRDPKSRRAAILLWGASHNLFNKALPWDDFGATLISNRWMREATDLDFLDEPEYIRAATTYFVTSFFRGSLLDTADEISLDNLDPTKPLPDVLSKLTRIDRRHHGENSIILEDFKIGRNAGGLGDRAAESVGFTEFSSSGDVSFSPRFKILKSHIGSNLEGGIDLRWEKDSQVVLRVKSGGFAAQGFSLQENVTHLLLDLSWHSKGWKSEQAPEMLVRMRRPNGVLTNSVNVSRYFEWRKAHISGVQGTGYAPAIGPFVSTVAIPLSDLGVAQLQDIESVVLELKAGEKILVGLGNVSLRRRE